MNVQIWIMIQTTQVLSVLEHVEEGTYMYLYVRVKGKMAVTHSQGGFQL